MPCVNCKGNTFKEDSEFLDSDIIPGSWHDYKMCTNCGLKVSENPHFHIALAKSGYEFRKDSWEKRIRTEKTIHYIRIPNKLNGSLAENCDISGFNWKIDYQKESKYPLEDPDTLDFMKAFQLLETLLIERDYRVMERRRQEKEPWIY